VRWVLGQGLNKRIEAKWSRKLNCDVKVLEQGRKMAMIITQMRAPSRFRSRRSRRIARALLDVLDAALAVRMRQIRRI
jgi:hypothetical protein